MPTTPIAYNTGSSIVGTTQTGSLAIGSTAQPYSNDIGGVKWWMGPEESTGFVIGVPVPGNTQPTPIPGVFASVTFCRSEAKTNSSFLSLTNNAFNQTFQDPASASIWLTTNGYWNTYVTTPYQVGENALGGVIAYILQPGDTGYDANVQHGLVVTPDLVSTGATWGCLGTLISGADGTAIGTGNQNTIDIMAGCITAGIAARLCGDLVSGGYSDWYLPSKDELNKLYINRTAIGLPFIFQIWSSSEIDDNGAWFQNFTNGAVGTGTKTDGRNVLAIRSF
jgi:hypothetical protein